MGEQTVRRLRDGTAIALHDNDGIRKICGCPRAKWVKCRHAWHFNFAWKGEHYRFSLNKHLGIPDLSKTQAERAAEKLRIEIRVPSLAVTSGRWLIILVGALPATFHSGR